MSRPRPVDLTRCVLGVGALLWPDAFLRLSGPDRQHGARPVVRVLGARYLAQSGGFLLDRSWVPVLDASVDLVHAASMLGLAAAVPSHRRLALLSAGAATIFAIADLREPRR